MGLSWPVAAVPAVLLLAAGLQTYRLSEADYRLEVAGASLAACRAALSESEAARDAERTAAYERAVRLRTMEDADGDFARRLAAGGLVADDYWDGLCRRPGAAAGDLPPAAGGLPGGGAQAGPSR